MKTKSETNSPKDTKETEHEVIKQSEKARKLVTGFLLACSYSSTIGGLGFLVGTAPNVLIKGYLGLVFLRIFFKRQIFFFIIDIPRTQHLL